MTEGTAQENSTNVQTISSSLSIQPIAEFNPDIEVGASLATRWSTWLADFEMFLLASGIQDKKRQRALLLYQAGSRIREIFRQLNDTGNDDDYERAKTKLTEYFEPQKNRRYEVYRFREAKQEQSETLDQFHTRLRKLAKTCAFADVDFEVEQQIIMAGTSSRIRKKALRDPEYKLKDILIDGRRDEQSTYQARDIESKDQKSGTLAPIQSTRRCHFCGGSYPHQGVCPAKGKSCHKCGKQNHFSKVCRGKPKREHSTRAHNKEQTKKPSKRPINPLKPTESDHSDSTSEGEGYLYTVRDHKTPKVRVTVCKSSFDATIDTGATINVLDKSTYEKMDGVHLRKTNIKAFAYTANQPVKFIGKFEALVETRKRVTVATFYVANSPDSGNLISASTAQELGLISLHVHGVTHPTRDGKINQILKKHEKVFRGLGKLKGEQIKLNIDATYPPKAQPQRRVPFHVREKVKAELEQLERSDIIERVPESQPTPWVSPIVIVPKKDGGVRLCVDMRQANSAIKRVRHPIPTVDDIRLELNGAKWFSKLDLSQAYHQLELEDNSRHITTFTTHEGLFRYKRLNYGTNAAAEIFQFTLQEQLRGLPGVRNIADDIIVYGKTREEHDGNLDKCLQRLYDKGLRLNQSKCTFLNKSLDFFGQVFSEGGTKPDPKRVTDLQNAPTPTNIHDVRSLLGMANYSSRYIANFATITAPLRELTKKNTKFEWRDVHQKAFQQLTSALSANECMAYFDTQKDTYITVDASPVGLSAILSQATPGKDDEKVVAYASRALTEVEKRYAQTEREALAIVWGVEHFHLFVYGKEFTLITDHKPLEVIYGNRNAKSSARVERWVLRLQPYSFKVVYKPGSTNPADYLSRHPVKTSFKQQRMTEEYVNFIALNSVPKAMTIEEIVKATDEDQVLKGVRAAVRLNKWDYDIVKQFKQIKDELSVTTQGVILRGTRIVIPKSLQQRAIDIAHDCHLGITKTKALLREKIWFPNMDQLVKDTLAKCIPCQAVGKSKPPEPMTMTSMPKGPWQVIHADFYGPLPSGEYLLVVIDRYSRYPEVEIVSSTKASAVIPKLDKMFATHGIPDTLKTDNGPPFNGEEYRRYIQALGIKVLYSTPYWPQGNGEVERFMQPLGKALKTAQAERRPWRQELNRFLLQYRTAPHSTTKVSPSELIFNRAVKGKLPMLYKSNIVNKHKQARDNEKSGQAYNKQYADNRRKAKHRDIAVGDCVLVKQKRQNKLTTNFDTTPYFVIATNKSQITAQNKDGHKITRNVSHFKRIPGKGVEEDTDIDDERYTEKSQQNTEAEPSNSQPTQDSHVSENANRRSTRDRRAPQRYGSSISWK